MKRSVTAMMVVMMSMLYAVFCQAQIIGTGQLNVERRAHTATLLNDGKVLIVGGDNQNGKVGQAEVFDPLAQTSSLAASLANARTDHTATLLPDGRVLVIGGRDQTGALTSSEIYNPLTATFTAGPSLTTPRSGHTATVLSDGRILVAGGDASASAELYNPLTENFSLLAANMYTGRKFHSAIRTSSGQVLIVGGVNAQNAVLDTAEVFDPSSQSFYLPPTDMQTPRALATLKLLADGKVQIIGGDAELSMEVFDPTDGIFIAKALLPPNADLLGATLSTQSRAALFSPQVLQDPLLQGVMTPEQSALLNRADQSITELPSRNQALVAGGISSTGEILNSATLVKSSSASITTDKTDYAPGQIVTITGSGFQPNEQVDISFHEFPEEYPDVFFSAIANQQGNFVTAEFAPQEIDLGRIFTLTAIGQSSGFVAQTAFKDARNWTLTFAGTGSGSVKITLSIGTVNAPDSCNGTGAAATSQTVTSTCLPNISTSDNGATVTLLATGTGGSTFAGWSLPASLSSSTCTGTTNPCSAVMGANAALTVTFNAASNPVPTTTSISPTSKNYGDAGFTMTVNGTNFISTSVVRFAGSDRTTTFVSSTQLTADIPASDLLTLGNLNITVFNPTPGGTSNAQTFTVNQAVLTVTADNKSREYGDANPAFIASYSGFKNGETLGTSGVTGSPSLTTTATPTSSVSGSPYTITAAIGTLAATNYSFAFVNGTLTVNAKVATVVADAKSKFYGQANPTLTAVVTGEVLGGDAINYTLATTATQFSVIGDYPITVTLGANPNYSVTKTDGSLTITTAFAFNGFYSPIGGSVENNNTGGSFADPVRAFKLGSTIPVKFGATWLNGGAALITGIHTLQAIKYSNSTDSEPAIDATPTDSATTGNQFRLTGTDWHFNLSTKGGFSAGTWLLRATLVDGSQHTVWITIKK